MQIIETEGTTLAETNIENIDPEVLPRIGKARLHLQGLVNNGTRSASRVVSRIMNEVPEDTLVKGRAARVVIEDGSTVPVLKTTSLELPLHPNAQAQLSERMGAPWSYTRRLVSGEPWQQRLAESIFTDSLRNVSEDRYLVRHVGGTARAFLSSKFKRIDSRPLLDATIQAATGAGAIPYQGTGSDVRVSVKFILPRVFEPVPGEVMLLGFDWRNSDYGKGPYELRGFALRLVCLNGMVGESNFKKVHVGGRISEADVFRQETLDKEQDALISATQDVVGALLGPAAVRQTTEQIVRAHESETDFAKAFSKVRKDLSKAETEKADALFNGDDVVTLPPRKSVWRASNALSHLANMANDDDKPERAMELQEMAAKVMN